jgi:exonuclease SbcC
VYAQLTKEQQNLKDESNRLTDTVAQLRAANEEAVIDLRTQEIGATQATDQLKVRRAEIALIQSLIDRTANWQTDGARVASVVESELAALSSLELLRSEEKEILPQLNALTAEAARLSRQIAEVDKSQSELKNLLSQLQGHIRTGTCPLCGEDHGSKDELVRRIQKHLAADAASTARADLTTVLGKTQQLSEQIASNKQKQQALEAQIADLKNERAKLDAEIGQFANSAAELGVIIEASSQTPAEQLQARLNGVQRAINELNQQIREIDAAVSSCRTTLTNTRNLLAKGTAELNDRNAALARRDEDITRIRNDPRSSQISVEFDDEQLDRDERRNLDNLTTFRAEAATAAAEVTQKRAEITALRQELTSMRPQLQTWRSQLGNLLQRIMTQLAARLQESKLPPDASEEMLLSLIAEEAHQQVQLLALRDSISSLELAIDALTTAAALTTLLQNARNKEKAVEAATRKRDQHQPWLGYFTRLSRLVSAQQNEAIANFTSEYGPRTSVIQRRLRSVYGFDDIEIQSHESTINVRVKRNGEVLRPTDYFSQSQQQTLLLGLFLTACISQTWSGFAPVFMDDPVTHFDDLNTYAFLDLIVGLLESDAGKRQFIISTCDEKLLQLARQKFRHLGEKAAFYRFDAIGPDGPLVEKISAF